MRIMVDCGSYSAFAEKKGEEIDVHEYIAYLRRNPQIDLSISCDVIPGKNGVRGPDPRAARRSYYNHQLMKDAGLAVVPVFHRQDEFEWFERYLADGEPHIALAAHPVKGQTGAIFTMFNRCFSIKPPEVKIHALGLSSLLFLKWFPIDTADSSSWVKTSQNYQIVVPRYDVNGCPNYSHQPRQIKTSDEAQHERAHLDQQSQLVRQHVEHFVYHEVGGVTFEDLRTESKAGRMRVCAKCYDRLAAHNNTELFHVTYIDGEMRAALLHAGAQSHLLSFYHLRKFKKRPEALANYLERSRCVGR